MTVEEKAHQLSASVPEIKRLNLPAYIYSGEALHGLLANSTATVFPVPIALGSTFDEKIMHDIASAIADEARITYKQNSYTLSFFSPVLDLFRDPRWGRGQETYGEDPYLNSRMGVNFVRGMQGDDPIYIKTMTALKHYVVHSGPENRRHFFNSIASERDFRESYLPSFKTVVTEAFPTSVMTSYNAYNGIPVTVNSYLIKDVLRRELGFQGNIVTDCWAIAYIYDAFRYGTSREEAVINSIKNEIDLDCGLLYTDNLATYVNDGRVKESLIDSALTRIWRQRFRLGFFEPKDKIPFQNIPDTLKEGKKHKEIAYIAAKESLVLLKNENNLLPLRKNLKKVLVVGPLGMNAWNQRGAYGGNPSSEVSFYDGIVKKIPDTKVDFVEFLLFPFFNEETVGANNFTSPDGKPGLLGEYFNNKTLSGEPVLRRIDSLIDFDWEDESPGFGIIKDGFSIRWTGYLKNQHYGLYAFKSTSDDGTRMFIDSQIVIADWYDSGIHSKNSLIQVKDTHALKLNFEYYENSGKASCKLSFGNGKTPSGNYQKFLDSAKDYDAIIFVGGISPLLESEESIIDEVGFKRGDRTDIQLPKQQRELLKMLKSTGKPVVLCLMSGSCLAIDWEKDNIPAILQTWYCGQEGGRAVADVLFGDYNPAGRLPITYYKSETDLPDISNYSMANRTYRFFTTEPLYPFGFGLSYTTFQYSDLDIANKEIELCHTDTLMIPFSLKNTGNRDGDEVVQLYVKNMYSKIPQPIKQLKGFKRLNLKAGESISDTFKLNLHELYYYDTIVHQYIVEPGKYQIQMGSSSQDIRLLDSINLSNCYYSVNPNPVESSVIYPNPADNILYIKHGFYDNIDVKIISLMGNVIKNVNMENKESVDLSDLESGIYIVKISNRVSTKYEKLIINH